MTGNERIHNYKRKIDKQRNKIVVLHLYSKNRKQNVIPKSNR